MTSPMIHMEAEDPTMKKPHLDEKDVDIESAGQLSTFDQNREDPNDRIAELEVIRKKYAILRALHAFEEWLSGNAGIESLGLTRVPENERRSPSLLNMILFWFSMNLQPGFLVTGAIGTAYGLSLNETMVIAIVGTFAGSIIPAWCATLCPATGLRQLAVARFTFGIFGAKLCSLVNMVINVGWGVSAVIVGGQLLVAASEGSISPNLGIVIMIVISWIISFLGFHKIHTVNRYSWILSFSIILAMWIQSPKYWATDRSVRSLEGIEHTAGAMTYFALAFGGAMSWSTMVGDYYVHYPADTPKWKIWTYTYIGLSVPSLYSIPLGVLIGGSLVQNPALYEIYAEGNAGGVIKAILTPEAWGKAACILFFISFMGYQSASFYSSSIDIQLIDKYLYAVPRFIWSTLLAAATLGLAIGGKDHLAGLISNFISLLGYWVIAFSSCLLIEHFVFRPKMGGYNAVDWRDQKLMPYGIAGTSTLLIAYALSTMGMVQTWYVGVLARKVAPNGGDVGDYISLISCFLLYPALRYIEIKKFGR